MGGRPNRLTAVRALFSVLLIPAGLMLASPTYGADEEATEQEARAWLERMNRAVRELDYEGHFVYSHGDTLDAMHIVHVNRDGRERERLLSLNGAAREVVRDDKAVTCLLPSRDRIRVSRRPIGRSFSPLLPFKTDDLKQNYRFSLGPERRVAGRQTVTVDIRPKDSLRYGFLLSLDLEQALPLRSVVRDTEGRVLTQILFTDLRTGDEVSGIELADLPEEIVGSQMPSTVQEMVRMREPCCEFSDLPAGFELSMHRHRATGKKQKAEHFVFSDGLSSVSVYIESYQVGRGLTGPVRRGSLNVLGLHLEPFQVTLLGEVPIETLEQFAENLSVVRQ